MTVKAGHSVQIITFFANVIQCCEVGSVVQSHASQTNETSFDETLWLNLTDEVQGNECGGH